MATNDSSTGGYLGPTTPAPLEDLTLDVVIAGLIAGVTGLDPIRVLPRDQPNQPHIPDIGVTWVSVGVMTSTPDDTPAQIHHPDGDGYSILRSFYRLDVLASFYGPKGDLYAKLTRDALYVAQNREAMRVYGLNLVGFDPIRRLPDIVATQTRRRSDLAFQLTQVIERRYEIRNVQSLDGTIKAQGGSSAGPKLLTSPLSTTPPAGA
ncbi:hypothetical protein LOK46_10585 [Methylobacterium sp. NMS14P]|uniref:phage neck terminator protein n=1 Tax=Methylobacterium sp. NMS14P TaxID=2894310 RepID=UPI00235897EB|nr:hypothetical protein [Methylobacterium sp. NMS14P]WCS27236.1 hypothetical protein LOK46_10585 [Methylobacterium sp. NMS14P]